MFAGTVSIKGSELVAWQKKVGDVCEGTKRNRWIGEAMVAHTFALNKTTAFLLEGRGGFRRPESHQEWYYASAKADVVFTLSPKAKLSIGLRSTNNTDKAAVGHGLVNWYGMNLGYSW
jgi:hypothetical protein